VHATGHYRNGILLTPITAELVATVAAGGADPRMAAFAPDRFAAR
jgi:glycine oxidase